MLENLRKEVLEANLELVRQGLVLHTFGNVSGISRRHGMVVIKPSGVSYETMRAEHMVTTDLEGRVIEGSLRPSSDLATHLALYRAFAEIGGVAHTHSEFATVWAQARQPIPCLGTTHADYFHGPVPVTSWLEEAEMASDYELNVGLAIERRFEELSPEEMPAVLVAGHGPFCWGRSAAEAAHSAAMLEYVARMAYRSVVLSPPGEPIPDALRDAHYYRKHGPRATYGQR